MNYTVTVRRKIQEMTPNGRMQVGTSESVWTKNNVTSILDEVERAMGRISPDHLCYEQVEVTISVNYQQTPALERP